VQKNKKDGDVASGQNEYIRKASCPSAVVRDLFWWLNGSSSHRAHGVHRARFST